LATVAESIDPLLCSAVPVVIGRHRLTPLSVALAIAGSLLAGCGGSSSGPNKSITLYNGQHVQTTDTLVAAFERATGIKVNVRSNDEDTFADEIVTEGSHSPADVIYTENSPVLEYLQGKSLLAPVDSTTLARTPSKYSSSQDNWLGVSTRVSVLIYNPSLIAESELPKSVLQMADPKYRGKLALAAGETDFQPIVASVERTYGHAAALKWLQAVKENANGHSYPDNETTVNEVNRGAAAFGVINQYYWYRVGTELGAGSIHSKLAYFLARDPGYVIDVSGAGILKSSKNQAAAQKFLAFLVSRQGQEIIAHSLSFEYPIVAGIGTATPETPFADLQPNSVTIPELGDGSKAIALLREAGLL
jgi:iron(III) transport system substrate-binding protein